MVDDAVIVKEAKAYVPVSQPDLQYRTGLVGAGMIAPRAMR